MGTSSFFVSLAVWIQYTGTQNHYVQTFRLLFFMSSWSCFFCRARCCCSLQTRHVMCLAPAKLKYLRISQGAKLARDNVAAHAAHDTSSQFPHISTRPFFFVNRNVDMVWCTSPFVHIPTCRLLLSLCSRGRCCRPARCSCSLQTRHVMCFSSKLKYPRISRFVKFSRDIIAAHAAHGTGSQLPHMSTRPLLLHRKADKALYTPHSVQRLLCFDPPIFFPFLRHIWQRMLLLSFRNSCTSCDLYCVCFWLLPQAAHTMSKLV